LGASPLGTYTVGYTTVGPCPSSATVSITITTAPSASFSYPASSYCTTGTDPLPVYPVGSSGGVYSATPAGLSVNPITGEVILSTSIPNTYTVTNTIAAAGGCAVAVASTTIQIDDAATVNANNSQIICYGSNVNLGGAVGGGASSGTWTGGSGTFFQRAVTLGET